MIRAVRAIIHGNTNVSEAYELYKNFCKSNPKPDTNPKPKN